jgi:hypothetical protein
LWRATPSSAVKKELIDEFIEENLIHLPDGEDMPEAFHTSKRSLWGSYARMKNSIPAGSRPFWIITFLTTACRWTTILSIALPLPQNCWSACKLCRASSKKSAILWKSLSMG